MEQHVNNRQSGNTDKTLQLPVLFSLIWFWNLITC